MGCKRTDSFCYLCQSWVCQCSICSVEFISSLWNSLSFQYPHRLFMPNIWGQNLTSVICWILSPEPTDSRNRRRVLVYSPQRAHPSGIFRKGCSILRHVVCLFAKGEAREYPSWHFGFDGPFTFLSDMPHVKKYCFLPVSSHWREQFHLVISLPYGAKHRHIQCSFFLFFSGNWSERMCNNRVSDTYPGSRVAQWTAL